jgi:hypothetical protein
MDCTVAVGTAMALIVKRLLGSKFTDYCKDLHSQLDLVGKTVFFFHFLSRLLTENVKIPERGSQLYVFNIPEYETLIGGAARGGFVMQTTPMSPDAEFVGFAKEFKNGPISFNGLVRHYYDAFFSDWYVVNKPSPALIDMRTKLRGNYRAFHEKFIKYNSNTRAAIRSFNANIINEYLETGKYPCPIDFFLKAHDKK